MNKEFTLAELVKMYGSKAQKESLKKRGNLSGKEFNILIKEVLTEWETHEVKKGRGSKRIITCSGKRSNKAKRVDKRSNNGQGQLIGEFELNSLVVSHLIQNKNKVSPMSATKWITELGIVDGKFTSALYGTRGEHLEKLQVQFSKMIKNYHKADSDIDMLDGFLQTYLRHLKGSLESVFNKLSKAEVITHKKEQWGCTTKNRYRKLQPQEIKIIEGIRHMLLHFHGIEGRDLFKTNMKEVKAFKKDFEEQLEEQLGLKFYYDAHYCVLQENDLGVRDYLDRLQEKNELNFTHKLTEKHAIITIEMFKGMHSERSLELANGRQKNITNTSDSDRVKSLKIMKQYAPMWELLLKYFRCTSILKSNQSAVEDETPIEIDGDKIDIIEQLEELTNIERIKQQANQFPKEIVLENTEQQGIAIVDNPIVETSKHCNAEGYYEYQAAMEDIREEIREYEEKFGDDAIKQMRNDAVIRELTREATAVNFVTMFTQKLQFNKEQELKEWKKLFEGGQPIKREKTTNDPLEVFKKIRYGRI